MEAGSNGKWYALFVATGEEDRVRERIDFRMLEGFKTLVPKRRIRERKAGKWEEKIRILFPGYVLLNGQMTYEIYNLIRVIPGVIRILKGGDGPQEINENEIELISRLTFNNEIIGCSSVYVQGERIVVIDGPLLGLEGYIQSIDKRKGRARVVLNLMGEQRPVELSIAMVQSA